LTFTSGVKELKLSDKKAIKFSDLANAKDFVRNDPIEQIEEIWPSSSTKKACPKIFLISEIFFLNLKDKSENLF
jgi:hypothetical protein